MCSVRAALLALPVLLLGGCAGEREDGEAAPRPPVPVTITAAIERGRIVLAPETVGAGPLVVLVSNQSGAPRRVALEPEDAGVRVAQAVAPRGVARLALDAAPGRYALRVPGLPAATLRVGRPRPSSRDRLLLP
jgi:hypothetical protein